MSISVSQSPEVPVNGTPDGTSLPTVADLTEALGVGTSLLVGRYRVELSSGNWWWSDELYAIHGWERHEVEPGLQVLRSRKHPDDRVRTVRAVSEALRTGRSFACGHRIVRKDGTTRSLVVVGQGRRNLAAGAAEVVGYVVDVTPVQKEVLERRASSVVSQAFVSRAVVEQAKGVVAVVRGIDDVAAEQVLQEAAREVGVPLQEAAGQLNEALRAEEKPGVTPAALKRALGTLHPVDRPRGRDPLLTRRPRNTHK